jgi:hypothetical protein
MEKRRDSAKPGPYEAKPGEDACPPVHRRKLSALSSLGSCHATGILPRFPVD